MTILDTLIDRLDSEADRRLSDDGSSPLSEWASERRRRALAARSHYVVSVTEDGQATQEVEFDQPPTLGQLIAKVGERAFVVSVQMRRRSLRDRVRLALAAE